MSLAVSRIGRNVRPFATARALDILPIAAKSPAGGSHSGMSDQPCTPFFSRKSASTQVTVALLPPASLHASTTCFIVISSFGPSVL